MVQCRDCEPKGTEQVAVGIPVDISADHYGLAAVGKLHQVQHHQHGAVRRHPVPHVDIRETEDFRILIVGYKAVLGVRHSRTLEEGIGVHMLQPAQGLPGLLHIRLSALNQGEVGAAALGIVADEVVFDPVLEHPAADFIRLLEFRKALGTEQLWQQAGCQKNGDSLYKLVHSPVFVLYLTGLVMHSELSTSSSGKAVRSREIRRSEVYCSLS